MKSGRVWRPTGLRLRMAGSLQKNLRPRAGGAGDTDGGNTLNQFSQPLWQMNNQPANSQD